MSNYGFKFDFVYLHDSFSVQTGRFSEQMPNNKRYVEEKRHQSQNERYPLIVVDAVLPWLVRIGQEVLGWHIVGVGNPANVVCVCDHGACELSRCPACDRRADELRRADQNAEEDEERDGVAARETIGEVVVLYAVGRDDAFEYVNELPDHFGGCLLTIDEVMLDQAVLFMYGQRAADFVVVVFFGRARSARLDL